MGVSGDQPLNIVTIHMVGRVMLTNFKGTQKKHFGVRKSQKSSHPKFIRTSKVSAYSLNNLFLTDRPSLVLEDAFWQQVAFVRGSILGCCC